MTTRQKIIVACEYAGITVTELARRLGVTQSSFSNRMKTGKFSQEELQSIAHAIGCMYFSGFEFDDGNRVE